MSAILDARIALLCAAALLLGACGGGGNKVEDDATDTVDEDVTVDTGTDGEDTTGEADVPEDVPEEEAPAECTTDGDCDNGLWCDGEETCGTDGYCEAGTPQDCDDENPCTQDSCDDDAELCVNEALDADGDGFPAMEAGGETCMGGTDCDDSRDDVYPGAPEDACDSIDNDCDGDAIDGIADDDGDDYLDGDPAGDDCGGDDCNDSDDTIYPGAPEGCDGTIDHDCDGDATEVEADGDGDGHSDPSCAGGDDCDDSDPDVYPGATEVCDLVDNDCDGSILDAPGIDDDGDGVPDESCGGEDCDDTLGTVHGAYDAPTGSTDSDVAAADEGATCDLVDQDCDGSTVDLPAANDDGDAYYDEACGGTDCDDTDTAVYPGAPENECDSIDNDCDGDAIDGIADDDDDDYMDDTCPTGDDCDDTDDTIHPGATEICDLVDQDCDGSLIDAPGADDDGDTVLDETCGGTDCDDTDGDVHPGASLDCGDDHDCDGIVDDDSDEDGYTWDHCGGTDCDDGDDTIHPDATLSCDSIDHDCNGYGDQDNDNDGDIRDSCPGGDDCDDTDPSIFQGATIACESIDRDCNGNPDNDQDGDGGIRDQAIMGWPACGGDDCDDSDPTLHVGATEICDLIDQDCDGDELDAPGADDDGDLVLDESCGGEDCDDTSARYHPTAMPDVCIADDYDCDTVVDTNTVMTPSFITGGTSDRDDPAIAWSGSEYGIVFVNDAGSIGNNTLQFFRMDEDGNQVGTVENLSTSTGLKLEPDIAWADGRWGIVWWIDSSSGTGAYLRTYAYDGSDPQPSAAVAPYCNTLMVPREPKDPAISSDGTEFGVAWECENASNESRIRFRTASSTGTWTGSGSMALSDGTYNDYENPDLAYYSGVYGIVFQTLLTPITGDTFNIYYDIADPAAWTSGTDQYLAGDMSADDALYPTVAGGMVDVGGGDTPGFGMTYIDFSSSMVSTYQVRLRAFAISGGIGTDVYVGSGQRAFIEYNGSIFGVLRDSGYLIISSNLHFHEVDRDMSLIDSIIVAEDPANENDPALAWGGYAFGATYRLSPLEIGYLVLPCTY